MFKFGKKKETPTGPQGFLQKLKSGLGKSSSRLGDGIKTILTHRKLDQETLDELEDLLIMSDLGVETTSKIITKLKASKYGKDITTEEVKEILAEEITTILQPVVSPLSPSGEHTPLVVIMCGVNGSGKTTTIGKLAGQFKEQGKSVLIAACDTFRAAAVEQLAVWSGRVNCPLIQGKIGADPASVAFEALEKAKAGNIDVVIIDTAGRLQNKTNLMEQLAKIIRVIKKADASAPHHSIIVLDATTGQNAVSQIKTFKELININGIIMTKLDGTAKGGVIVNLAAQFALPIHAIGIGEGIEDLQSFDANIFAKSLVGL